MDSWGGKNFDPVTLHKYLYAGNDPVLMIDPSGYSFDLSSFSIANSIAARLTTLAVTFPRATILLEAAAGAATPIELAALSPVTAGLIGGGAITYAGVKHLDEAMKLAQSSYWLSKFRAGTSFEKFISEVINAPINTRSIFNGSTGRGTQGFGWAVPDFFFRGGILEAKLSGAAVNKQQFVQYLRYLGDDGNLTYVFKTKPADHVIYSMERWIKEEGVKVNLQIAYLFE